MYIHIYRDMCHILVTHSSNNNSNAYPEWGIHIIVYYGMLWYIIHIMYIICVMTYYNTLNDVMICSSMLQYRVSYYISYMMV